MFEKPIILVLHRCSLPRYQDAQEQFVQELEAAMADVLTSYGVRPGHARLYDGPMYAQTNTHVVCPECRERLIIKNLRLGPMNGVDAQAVCDCGWRGRAVYRLVDLEEGPIGEDVFEVNSCVGNGELAVDYTPYQNTEYQAILADLDQRSSTE